MQDDQPVDTEESSIGLEDGTTFTAWIHRADTLAVVSEVTDIDGDTTAIEAAYTGPVILELLAVRGGLESWQSDQTFLDCTEPPPP